MVAVGLEYGFTCPESPYLVDSSTDHYIISTLPRSELCGYLLSDDNYGSGMTSMRRNAHP